MSDYFIRLARLNGFSGPEEIIPCFQPGMDFDSLRKWWGDHGSRQTVHEGLDICYLQRPDGSIHPLGSGLMVSPVQPGTVVRICRDFLERTVVLSHGRAGSESGELLSLYAHLVPDQGMSTGDRVSAEDILGRIVQSSALPDGMLPHLHISLAWNEWPFTYAHLEWPRLSRREGVRFLDPLPWIEEGRPAEPSTYTGGEHDETTRPSDPGTFEKAL